ncbi:hypothetical protein N7490_000122 [Penicillium lividum]|nr:hypothetical protein N7490_000122 [Penicillium lividum]
MRLSTKGCMPFLSPVTNRGWSRGVRTCSSARWTSTAARTAKPSTLLGATWVRRVGITDSNPCGILYGVTQSRSLRKANYVEKIGDNERTEELLESLEVRHDEEDTRPQVGVNEKNAKLAEDMSKGIEPIAILVHPQQPLSYLEQLIQSEVPPIKGEKEKLRPPAISFIALQHEDNAIRPKKHIKDLDPDSFRQSAIEKENQAGSPPTRRRRSREEDAEIYSYPRKTDCSLDPLEGKPERFVRWSQATEVGDFIRDAARTREFIVSIEGAPSGLGQIRVTVPSFDERTYFLRMRLRKLSRRIQGIAEIKHKCDELALRGAQRVAIGGFGILSVWWYSVYKLTFETDLGWDTMEPVTYLVSLSTLMGGYLWFLYHNREISYKSALDFTVSARQKKLYQSHNVDLQLWETLIDEGKALRREIKGIAAEYDAEWNERVDEQDERVTEALRSDRGDEEKKERKEKDSD